MPIVFAIPFRKRAPKAFASELRALVPGCKIVASHAADATMVRGADVNIFHMNSPFDDVRKIPYYGNEILKPLAQAAVQQGEYVFMLHDNVIASQPEIDTLVRFLNRIPSMVFASAQPRMIIDPVEGKPVPIDWPDRFLVWRSSQMLQYLEAPFTVEDHQDGRSTMTVVMERIRQTGLVAESGWTWQMDMVVREKDTPIAPPP